MKVLFVRFSSLGDIILTTGVIRKFKELFPDAQADVLTYAPYADVFKGLPFVNRVLEHNKKDGLIAYFNLIQRETEDYDHVFDLHGKLLSMFLRFHAQADYHKYVKDSAARRRFVKTRKADPRLGLHVVQKYFEPIAQTFNVPMPSLEELRPVLFSDARSVAKHVLVHPFASRYTKTYPYAGELAELLIENGYMPVFAGDGKAPDVKGIIDRTGKSKIKDFFDTIASCGAVISSDSGPLHVAVALKKPTVGIFGSTTKHFGFYPAFDGVRIVEDDSVECRPCDVHGLAACPKGHFDCMKRLTPDKVLQVLKSL
jgi:ADP-heptose:LPS heptosyltransferase